MENCTLSKKAKNPQRAQINNKYQSALGAPCRNP